MTGFVVVGVVSEVKLRWPSGHEGRGTPAVDVHFSGGKKGNPVVVTVRGQAAMKQAQDLERGAVVWVAGQAPYGGIRSRVTKQSYFTEAVCVNGLQIRTLGAGDAKKTEPCAWFFASGTVNKAEVVREDGVEHGPAKALDLWLNVYEEAGTRRRRERQEHPPEMLVVRVEKKGQALRKAQELPGGSWVFVSAMTPWGGVATVPTQAMYWTEARVSDEAQIEVLP